MLSAYTRHYPPCTEKNPAYRRCKCPKWIQGTTDSGEFIRRSAKTRSWEKAEKLARSLEESLNGGTAVPPPFAVPPPDPNANRVTIDHAVETYLADAVSRGLTKRTVGKLRVLAEKQLLKWAKGESLTYLDEFTTDNLTLFRNTWADGPLSRSKKHDRMIGFFKFCIDHKWIQENPAKPMGKVKVKQVPTDYFPPDEFAKIIDATYAYRPKGDSEYRHQSIRIRTLILLMRWSGLRISDAVTLERSRLIGDDVLLYQAKTGTPVYVPLPPQVAEALRSVPPGHKPNPGYFFWSGNGDRESAVKDWQRSLRRVFKIANITKADGTKKRCFPQMFRDTFAIELLLSGVPIDQVSVLLGHSSVKITEKHYAPWVKARQDQLEASVQKSWKNLDCMASPKPPESQLALLF
ncbi:MAG: site-specific integrase [Acidobacteriaceae bacterium]|nr:site-specific integrase [Acidobacteriaceae bacterium]